MIDNLESDARYGVRQHLGDGVFYLCNIKSARIVRV